MVITIPLMALDSGGTSQYGTIAATRPTTYRKGPTRKELPEKAIKPNGPSNLLPLPLIPPIPIQAGGCRYATGAYPGNKSNGTGLSKEINEWARYTNTMGRKHRTGQ